MSEPVQTLPTELGIIEGYFGPAWSWTERRQVMELLARHGYRFFHYAPKADAYLRRQWREPHPEAEGAALAGFAAACRAAGVRFGVGLSPYEAYLDFDGPTREALSAKIAALDALGLDDLAILFDDMRGDVPDLAERQAEMMDFVASRTKAERLLICPTYYSFDPVLDRAFGKRPDDYLKSLGRLLDRQVEVFWTGEEVCSREQSTAHLRQVADQLGRRPFLWDNYPVNDGPRMSQHLHLRGFTGRRSAIANSIAGHAVNPALQPLLGCIPALTLAASYRDGDGYAYGAAFLEAARVVAGEDLAKMLLADLLSLADVGLDRLGSGRERLRGRYGPIDHPAAREVVAWLDGRYATSGETVQTQ